MFKRSKCPRCGKKTDTKNDFCPSCGNRLNSSSNQEDWGMLGKNDFVSQNINPFENLGGGMLGKMLGNAMKMLEKELQKAQKPNPKISQMSNIELFVNGKKIDPKNIRITKKPMKQKENTKKKEGLKFSSEKAKKFSKLEKTEPTTNVRRLSNKIIYEIEIPGVKDIKDISLTSLENSIEIKALGKNKAYHKIISLGLPIIDYNLSKGVFELELEAKN